MKIAQGQYHLAQLDMVLYAYFDPKAFDLIVPPLGNEEQNRFIEQICDSIALAIPKGNHTEKQFYIKRAYKNPGTRHITLFCTDNFLIDTHLVIPIQEQPFQNERIRITDVEQLPPRFRLSTDVLNTMNEKLIEFEEIGRKIFSHVKTTTKETTKTEREMALREFTPDKTADILSEIHHLRKEIIEIGQNRTEFLKKWIPEIHTARMSIYDAVRKIAKEGLIFEENKKKSEEFAERMIEYYCSDFLKECELLKKKLDEIKPISSQFETETDQAYQFVKKEMSNLATFKDHVIRALYNSANECREVFLKEWAHALPNAKKILLNEFNRKFSDIASLSETAELNDYAKTNEKLNRLTLEDLQEIISNDDKDRLGLLQKCNTSWTTESPELQIVLKQLTALNNTLKEFFKTHRHDEQNANEEMSQIIRIPFPRGFQFKFSEKAFNYKNTIDAACKTQKEKINEIAKAYKKILQIDEDINKIKRTMTDAEKKIDTVSQPVKQYRDLFKHKETSGEIIKLAAKEYEYAKMLDHIIAQLQQSLAIVIDPHLKVLRKKIDLLVTKVKEGVESTSRAIDRLNETKIQLDTSIKKTEGHQVDEDFFHDVEKKIRSMKMDWNAMVETNKKMQHVMKQLAFYEKIIKIGRRLLDTNTKEISSQQAEAKKLVVQFIKQEHLAYGFSEERKKEALDLYNKIDTHAMRLQKENTYVVQLKDYLLTELNQKNPHLSEEEFENELESIETKMNELESIKNQIATDIQLIREMI